MLATGGTKEIKMKLKIGQIIYLKPVNNQLRRGKEIKEVEISRIGRKWFYVKTPGTDAAGWEWQRDKFDIDTLNQSNGEYVNDWDGYLSLKEIEDEKEQLNLYMELGRFFSEYGRSSLSLGKLQEMYKIACR